VLDSTEAVVAAYRYDPFGNLLAQTGSLTQPFTFSTKRYDPQTGLAYYGHYFYSPTLGRWTTRDPLGEAAILVT
jgi:RHS repeat-associated protein